MAGTDEIERGDTPQRTEPEPPTENGDEVETADGIEPEPTAIELPDRPFDVGHRCRECGYNLTGTFASGLRRCPECGHSGTPYDRHLPPVVRVRPAMLNLVSAAGAFGVFAPCWVMLDPVQAIPAGAALATVLHLSSFVLRHFADRPHESTDRRSMLDAVARSLRVMGVCGFAGVVLTTGILRLEPLWLRLD